MREVVTFLRPFNLPEREWHYLLWNKHTATVSSLKHSDVATKPMCFAISRCEQ
jgi:hypothetical protein